MSCQICFFRIYNFITTSILRTKNNIWKSNKYGASWSVFLFSISFLLFFIMLFYFNLFLSFVWRTNPEPSLLQLNAGTTAASNREETEKILTVGRLVEFEVMAVSVGVVLAILLATRFRRWNEMVLGSGMEDASNYPHLRPPISPDVGGDLVAAVTVQLKNKVGTIDAK